MDLYENNYTLVFEEKFDGGLDGNKWVALDETIKSHSAKKNTDFVPSHVITQAASEHEGAAMHYKPENVAVKNGELVITAGRDGDGFQGGKCVCNGVVFAHGYVEVEVLLPAFQKGVWPRFSIAATDGNHFKVAYDVVAIHGDKGKNAYNLYVNWIGDIYENEQSINILYGAPKRFYPDENSEEVLSPGYHKFGIEITEDFIIFYCDGVQWNRIDVRPTPYAIFGKKNMCKFTAEMSIGLPNIAAPEADADFPTEFKIRSIKLYQNSGDILVKR